MSKSFLFNFSLLVWALYTGCPTKHDNSKTLESRLWYCHVTFSHVTFSLLSTLTCMILEIIIT